MVTAALTALKSTNDDFGIGLLVGGVLELSRFAKVAPHPSRILSFTGGISREG